MPKSNQKTCENLKSQLKNLKKSQKPTESTCLPTEKPENMATN